MSMDELYEEMKDVLAYLGLKFADKDKVAVHICDGRLYFVHGDREISIKLEEE